MPGRSVKVETLGELQIWIEGQFALVVQAQESQREDLTNIRRTVHEHAGHLQVIISLNLADRLTQIERDIKNIQTIDGEQSGAMNLIKGVLNSPALGWVFGAVSIIWLYFTNGLRK
jgi:hypothetical protein